MTSKPNATTPITAPASRLLSHAGVAALTRKSRRRGAAAAALRLTPLIDIMVVLVLFLLVRFQTSGE